MSSDRPTPEVRIARFLLRSFEGRDGAWILARMRRHYELLRLLDAEGRWRDPALEAVDADLLPRAIDEAYVARFLDEVAALAHANPYLRAFLAAAESERFPDLERALAAEGAHVLPDAVAYALVLEFLNRAMTRDPALATACFAVWDAARASEPKPPFTLFEHAKIRTVRHGLESEYRDRRAKIALAPGHGRWLIVLNVIEAGLEDLRRGYVGNAICAGVLAAHPTGARRVDARTGEGPTEWSDAWIARMRFPLPVAWNDLYTTWNLAFVAGYPNFPYFMAKLLHPFVAGYRDVPEEYVVKRGLSLYTHIHFEYFRRLDAGYDAASEVSWSDRALGRLWSRVNRVSALAYASDVAAARQGRSGRDAVRANEGKGLVADRREAGPLTSRSRP